MPDSVLKNDSDPGSLPRVTPTPTSTYVREAKPGEISALADVYARAFARDPMMNWLGGVRALVPADHYKAKADGDGVDASVRRTLAGLRHFQLLLTKMARILGLIIVVVEKDSEGEGEGERIVGGALWLKPGASLDPSPRTFLRVSPWRVIWSWGLGVLKRTLVDYTPTCEKITDGVFAARGLKRLDAWYVLEIAIDPDCEGKGYCSLLMRDGFQRASGTPVHLEATTPRSRDIYAHMGFELNKEHRFGVGSVDEMGIVAKGEAAVGCPIFIMTKWENP